MYETFCENCSHFILKWFQPDSFGEVCFLEESYENMQKFKFWKFWDRPLFDIREYAFNLYLIRENQKMCRQVNKKISSCFWTASTCTEEFRMMFLVDLYGNHGLDSRKSRLDLYVYMYSLTCTWEKKRKKKSLSPISTWPFLTVLNRVHRITVLKVFRSVTPLLAKHEPNMYMQGFRILNLEKG